MGFDSGQNYNTMLFAIQVASANMLHKYFPLVGHNNTSMGKWMSSIVWLKFLDPVPFVLW